MTLSTIRMFVGASLEGLSLSQIICLKTPTDSSALVSCVDWRVFEYV